MINSKTKTKYAILYKYIGKEYFLAFCVAFVFFFFIFFINQILLLARKILLSNVDFYSMINLVILAIPQFLLYTFPFASLSGASMAIGNFSSTNEILAMRSIGISMKKIYTSILVISIIISGITFCVADILLPYSAVQYQDVYIKLLTKMPALEVKANSSTSFGNIVISNGDVNGSEIEDIVVFDSSQTSTSKLITAKKGNLSVIDIDSFIYSLELENPKIMVTDKDNKEQWNLANSKNAIFYIDFSEQVPHLSATPPSNLSTIDLLSKIKNNKIQNRENVESWKNEINDNRANVAKVTNLITSGEKVSLNTINNVQYNILNERDRPMDFYLQYYRAELNKKFALSAACFFLVFMTFPLSYIKFRHGKLVGFALSMTVAVIYWYMLFFAQLKIFYYPINPLFLIWAPNVILFVVSLLLIKIWRN